MLQKRYVATRFSLVSFLLDEICAKEKPGYRYLGFLSLGNLFESIDDQLLPESYYFVCNLHWSKKRAGEV